MRKVGPGRGPVITQQNSLTSTITEDEKNSRLRGERVSKGKVTWPRRQPREGDGGP